MSNINLEAVSPLVFFCPKQYNDKFYRIDSLAENAIAKGATPGCVILAVKDGKIAYHKAFGNFNYDKSEAVNIRSVYDMASVTKICATTIAIMKLYDQDKINLNKKLGDYLPLVKGTNKESLLIKDILLHQAGLVSFIPFYKEIIDTAGTARTDLFALTKTDSFQCKSSGQFIHGKRMD